MTDQPSADDVQLAARGAEQPIPAGRAARPWLSALAAAFVLAALVWPRWAAIARIATPPHDDLIAYLAATATRANMIAW